MLFGFFCRKKVGSCFCVGGSTKFFFEPGLVSDMVLIHQYTIDISLPRGLFILLLYYSMRITLLILLFLFPILTHGQINEPFDSFDGLPSSLITQPRTANTQGPAHNNTSNTQAARRPQSQGSHSFSLAPYNGIADCIRNHLMPPSFFLPEFTAFTVLNFHHTVSCCIVCIIRHTTLCY